MINFIETQAAITLLHCGVILYFSYFSNKEIYNKSNILRLDGEYAPLLLQVAPLSGKAGPGDGSSITFIQQFVFKNTNYCTLFNLKCTTIF